MREAMLVAESELEMEPESMLSEVFWTTLRRKKFDIFPFRVGEDGADELVLALLLEVSELKESTDWVSDDDGVLLGDWSSVWRCR